MYEQDGLIVHDASVERLEPLIPKEEASALRGEVIGLARALCAELRDEDSKVLPQLRGALRRLDMATCYQVKLG